MSENGEMSEMNETSSKHPFFEEKWKCHKLSQ